MIQAISEIKFSVTKSTQNICPYCEPRSHSTVLVTVELSSISSRTNLGQSNLTSADIKGSALFRYRPNNQDDYFIIKGFTTQSGLLDSEIHPEKGIPFHEPPHASDDERGTGLGAAMGVAMVLIFIITTTRLSLRYFRSDLKWGWDDWMMIPAAVCLYDSQ